MQVEATPTTVVIFGASGDLTQRKLVPALHSLACEGLLPEHVRILGIARSSFTDEGFREHLYEGVEEYARHKPEVCRLWLGFADRHRYLQGNYDDPETYTRLVQWLVAAESSAGGRGNRLFYLAVPPALYPVVIRRLGEAGLNRHPGGWTRVIIEKPFGHDYASARALNGLLHEAFDESQVFRIDHYLGKETVQNILTLRFANAIFEPLWSRNYVDHVQITVAERVPVGRRGGYYETAGVLRDMFQNHLLQLLTLVAMDPPPRYNADMLRDEKVKVLHAIRPPSEDDLVLGQYVGYRDEQGVNPMSRTPTYAALRLYIDNWRWQGVPFFLRSGKGLAEKVTEITLSFKQVPHLLFDKNEGLQPNRLSICIQPNEAIHLSFQTKIPGGGMCTKPVHMVFAYAQDFGTGSLPEAYERLLLDALQGEASLFTRADEIELSWQLIDPLTQTGSLLPYDVGSWGPEEAGEAFLGTGRRWYHGCCGDNEETRVESV